MSRIERVTLSGANADQMEELLRLLERVGTGWTRAGKDPVVLSPKTAIEVEAATAKSAEGRLLVWARARGVKLSVTWTTEATDTTEPEDPDPTEPEVTDKGTTDLEPEEAVITEPETTQPGERDSGPASRRPSSHSSSRDIPLQTLARFVRRSRALGRVRLADGRWLAAWVVAPRIALLCRWGGRDPELPPDPVIELGYGDPELRPARLRIVSTDSPMDVGRAGRLVLTAGETEDGRSAGAFGWLTTGLDEPDKTPIWMWLSHEGEQVLHVGVREPPDAAGAGIFDAKGRLVATVDAGAGNTLRWPIPPVDRGALKAWIKGSRGSVRSSAPLALRSRSSEDGGELQVLIGLRRTDWLLPSWFQVEARVERLLVGRIPADRLEELASDEDVATIEGPRPGLVPVTEGGGTSAGPVPGGPLFGGLDRISRGGVRCVLVIVDAGLDVHHPTLRRADGSSRVVGVWDQGGTGPTPLASIPGAPDTGRWYGPGEVDEFAVKHWHGTTVAMVAGGRPEGPWPGGVAQDCPIVFVRWAAMGVTEGVGSSFGLVAALNLAAALDFDAVVVNMSLGTHGGGHDGSTLVEEAIDLFTQGGRARGRVVVKSAGNDGGQRRHALISRPGTGPDRRVLAWSTPFDDGERRPADLVELWHDPRDQYSLELTLPTGDVRSWGGGEGEVDEVVGDIHVRLERSRLSPENGDTLIQLLISPIEGAVLPAGSWSLALAGEGVQMRPVHAWLDSRDGDATDTAQFGKGAGSVEITIPGTARTVVTVGATGEQFSSSGPTRDGREKPEVSAPGVVVGVGDDGAPFPRPGTSFAAPAVAGLVASALARTFDSGMPTTAQVRAALVVAAGADWTRSVGHGEPDAVRFFEALGLRPLG